MNRKTFWAVCIAIGMILAAAMGTSAQDWQRAHYSGVINDYPLSISPAAGPWELRGPWSLNLHPHGRADFSASLTMEFSDLGAGSGAGVSTDSRHPHTHHIRMKDATLVWNPPQTDCPSNITPYPCVSSKPHTLRK